MRFDRKKLYLLLTMAILFIASPILAQEGTDTAINISALETLQDNINIVWTCVAAFLVFFMQAGFALVESGFTRAKNTVNIMMKNLMDSV
jgi:Amt family ammonium transporter